MSGFTGPGVYPGVPELSYHARDFGPRESLSSTEAKRILEAPAVFRWYRDHPEPPKDSFDAGHVIHSLVLGTGLDLYVHDWPDLRSKAAREDVAQARAAGMVPVKRADYEDLSAVADAVLTDPLAGPLFQGGTPEQSIYATDPDTGAWMRGRLDWVTDYDGQPAIVDLKTTARSAVPTDFARDAATYDYALQREFYRLIWAQLGGGEDVTFLHVVVSKTPPHLVAVGEMSYDFESVGKAHVRRALDTYAHCLATDTWPGIPPIVHRLQAPAWYVAAEDDLEAEMEMH